MASENYHVILQGRDKNTLAESCRLVKEKGGNAEEVIADLNSPEAIQSLVEAVGTEPLHLLVNNAGITCVKPFEEITLEEWQQVLDVNVTAPFLLSKELLPLMERGASIVNTLSTASRIAFPGWSAYCMSKHALDGFMKTIREELRERGIRVINIYPAATGTDIWKNVPGDWPLERMMRPQDVAEAVGYAVNQPQSVVVENITVGAIGGSI
jgi:NAD(P)-dependent dehydrogenase (short-subunit alcohol dehydrogenase family)